MSPKRQAAWKARLDDLNAAQIGVLQLALMREFHIVVAEYATVRDPRVLARRHELRLLGVLGRAARDTAARFGVEGLAMLAGADPVRKKHDLSDREKRPTALETKAEPLPEKPAGQVLRRAAEAVIGAALAGQAAGVLASVPSTVEAAETALALSGGDVAAAAARLAGETRFAAAVNEAALGALVSPAGEPAVAAAGGATGPGEPPRPPNRPPPAGGGSDGGSGGPSGGRGRPSRRTFGQRVEAHVRHWVPLRARKVAAGSETIIRQILEKAAREGWSEAKTAKALDEALGGVGRWRAARIARTEIGAAQNAAILFTAEGAQRKVNKTWATIRDLLPNGKPRARHTHIEADGQTVAHDQAFIVGGASLMHPGDPEGPLEEIVSCRCGMLIWPA